MQKLVVSASGIRGIVGSNLSPELATKVAKTFSSMMGNGPIIVGGDTRTSHDMLKQAATAGLLSIGRDVIDIDRVSTPTLQQAITKHAAAGGIVITASHNPIEWNGLKLMNRSGAFFEADEFAKFKSMLNSDPASMANWSEMGTLTTDPTATQFHIDKIIKALPITSIVKRKPRVLVDANHGAGAAANPILFKTLGLDADMIGGEADGRFSHDPEPLEQNLSLLKERMKSGDYQIGFAQDADADRLVIIDENGRFIGEDVSLAFCIDYILAHHNEVPNKEIVVNLSTSNLIQWIAEKHKARCHQTAIGETHVTKKLKDCNAIVGGEGNGGIIYPTVGWGRDSLLGIVIALKYICESGKSVSEIVSDYPKFTMLRNKIAVGSHDDIQSYLDRTERKFSKSMIDRTDGIKVNLPEGWIHVRPSNTEPIVRIFIEAISPEAAETMWEKVNSET